MVGQLGTDGHSLHTTMCQILWKRSVFQLCCFLLVLQIPLKCQNVYLYLHSVPVSRLCSGLALLWPFFSSSLWPALMVPGFRQVSGRRKDLFCCFGSPVSAGSQGKGWGGSTTHLCLRLVWPLSCGHTPLHWSALLWDSFYTVWYDIRCPLPLEILSMDTLSAYFSWLGPSFVITHAQVLHS